VTSRPEAPHPLWELTKARLREFFREKGMLFWVFGFPLLMAIGLGLAFRNRPPELPRVGVVAPSTPAVQALLKSPRVDAKLYGEAEARRALATSKLDLVLAGSTDQPVFRFDPTQERSSVARLVVGDILQESAGRVDPVRIATETVTETGSRYIDFLLPGLIGLNLMGSSMWGVGYNLVVARKRKLLRRYAVTPMRRTDFLLSYFFSRCCFLVAELVVLLVFGALIFGTSVRGSYAALAILSFWGAASFAAVSLLIGARVENTESANGWMNFVQLPMWVLSGSFFSYERFPEWLHGPIRALPLTALCDALRAIYNDGASLVNVLPQTIVLCVWGGVGFLIALKTFRWQ
jgi:ABC-2 type transport system permease protein